MENKEIVKKALDCGAYKAGIIDVKDIVLDKSFRDLCASNVCGMYGKCYMCPPDVGDINELMANIAKYDHALVYQTVNALEDSFDFEAMTAAKKRMYLLSQSIRGIFYGFNLHDVLHLGAGGCGVCDICAKRINAPCRAPELAIPSLEAYGINVSELAKTAGMKYTNGQNTVTYFGAVLFSANKNVTVILNGKKISAERGKTLSEITGGEKPCGGHGKCGKCKVIVKGEVSALTETEKHLLSPKETAAGVRLGCMAHMLGNCKITTISRNESLRVVSDSVVSKFELNPVFERYGVAIDIGTTTLAARIYNTKGEILGSASSANPQQKHGTDVISRIEAALGGNATQLAISIRQAVDDIISKIALTAKVDTKKIDGVVTTGNTVMMALLTKESAEPFSHAPFNITRLFGETLTACELELQSLSEQTPVYIPPCISAFVGADTVCAILATGLCKNRSAMLADIGTNGELALWHNGKLTVCSTAAGPAFEGVGICMGMRCADGAIDRVYVENGELKAHIINNSQPIGICGSGLVDAAACMLDLNMIDENGYLEDDKFVIRQPVYITPKDIRMLQLAKSAISAGISTLIENAKSSASDISTLYIAGGFGSYLNKENAAKIGLIPKAMYRAVKAVGNAALGGAAMMLLNKKARDIALCLAKDAVTVELSTDPLFSEKYILSMPLKEI